MIRVFVGLALPPELGDPLGDLAVGIPGARWVEAHNLHVTLRFIGEIEDGLAREIHDELASIRAAPVDLTVDGFGTFGSRQPRALWAGVEKTAELSALQAKVDNAVTRVGVAAEPRKFLPHITLARLKNAHTGRLQEFIVGHSPLRLGPAAMTHFTLFRSHLGRAGAEYEPLAEYPLE